MRRLRVDVEGLIKDSKTADERLAKLKEELENIPELPSVDNKTGVRSSDPSDLTAQTALRRLKILAEIEEILLDKEMLNYALKRLTEDERALINGFFYPKKQIGVFVHEYGRTHGLCKDYVYDERTRVLDKIEGLIHEGYYGED